MLPNEYKWGYCRNCIKNVPHHEWHSSPFFRFLDEMTFRQLRLIRIGPWHCIHCHVASYYLRHPHSDAVDYPIHELVAEPGANEALSPEPVESVGNFIRSQESLVMRSKRLKRFSEKYRDAVVRRILKGSTTMAQVRQEMEVSETELVDWISDIFDRQQARLDAMENAVEAIPQLRILNERERSNSGLPQNSLPASVTVEGQVRPK